MKKVLFSVITLFAVSGVEAYYASGQQRTPDGGYVGPIISKITPTSGKNKNKNMGSDWNKIMPKSAQESGHTSAVDLNTPAMDLNTPAANLHGGNHGKNGIYWGADPVMSKADSDEIVGTQSVGPDLNGPNDVLNNRHGGNHKRGQYSKKPSIRPIETYPGTASTSSNPLAQSSNANIIDGDQQYQNPLYHLNNQTDEGMQVQAMVRYPDGSVHATGSDAWGQNGNTSGVWDNPNESKNAHGPGVVH